MYTIGPVNYGPPRCFVVTEASTPGSRHPFHALHPCPAKSPLVQHASAKTLPRTNSDNRESETASRRDASTERSRPDILEDIPADFADFEKNKQKNNNNNNNKQAALNFLSGCMLSCGLRIGHSCSSKGGHEDTAKTVPTATRAHASSSFRTRRNKRAPLPSYLADADSTRTSADRGLRFVSIVGFLRVSLIDQRAQSMRRL